MIQSLAFRVTRATALAAILCTGVAVSAAVPKQTNTREAAQTARQQDRRADQREVCVRIEMSGTRVPRRVCRTMQEWEAEGGLPEAR